jgi:hypothetical protein
LPFQPIMYTTCYSALGFHVPTSVIQTEGKSQFEQCLCRGKCRTYHSTACLWPCRRSGR